MPAAREDGADDSSDRFKRKGEADAWNAISLILSGMLVWGGAGWLVSRWLDQRAFIGVGLVVGTAAGVALVWLRYGRQT